MMIKPPCTDSGMQPLLYSEQGAELGVSGWTRVGSEISYTATKAEHMLPEMNGRFYTLTWTMVSHPKMPQF